MGWKVSNFAQMTLLQSIQAADTTIYVSAADAALLPSLGVGDKAKLVIFDETYREIVNITANVAGTLTVERGKESTAARAWAAGVVAIHTPTAEIIQSILNTVAAVKYVGTITNISNAYTLNVGASNPLPSFVDGEEVSGILPAANTGASTLAITDGTTTTAAKAIVKSDETALDERDLMANTYFVARYSGTLSSWVIIDTTSYNIEAYQINDAPIPAFNRHSNGRVNYWKNGTSFSSPSTGTETADGWFVDFDGTIGTFAISRQTFTPGDTSVDGQPTYYYRWDHSVAGSGSTIRRIKVPIPNARWQNGKKFSRSVWMKAEAAHTIPMKIVQNFGTGGGPSADVTVVSQNCSVTTSWQKFKIEGQAMPSVTGKTFGSNADDAIVLYLELPLNTVMTIDVACDDLRPGNIAGIEDHAWPVSWRRGGLGGSYTSLTDFMTINLPDLQAIEALSGTNTIYYRSASNTWSAVAFGANLTFSGGILGNALGTVVTHADSEYVHITGTESISGAKNFTGAPSFIQNADVDLRLDKNNTNTNYMAPRWSNSATTWELTPAPANTPDATKGFGYDVTNARWFCDTPIFGALGTVTNVAFALGAAGTGLYSTSVGTLINVAIGGAEIFRFSATRVLFADGTVGSPNGFISETNTGRYRIGAGNVGEAVAGALNHDWNATRMLFASGVDVVLNSATGPSSVYSLGFRASPINTQNTAYGLVLTDAGQTIYHDEVTARTYTIPANASVAYPIGTVIIIDNTGNAGAAGALTIAITSDTLRRADATAGTGSRTVAASSKVSIQKTKSTEWDITGTGLT